MSVGDVSVWMKLRDPKSHSSIVKGTFNSADGQYLIPSDLELSTIQALTMTPLDHHKGQGSQLTVAGSFEKGDARDIPSGSVQLSVAAIGTAGGQVDTDAGSVRIGYDVVGW